jgi:hypothetical protein
MGRELTQIEREALIFRFQQRAKEITQERLKDKGIPFVTDMQVCGSNGIAISKSNKCKLLETAWVEGMIEGVKVFNAFRDDMEQACESVDQQEPAKQIGLG